MAKDKGAGREHMGTSSGAPVGVNYLLVIAIDAYEHCPTLSNCIKDATDFVKVLTTRYAFNPENIHTLYNDEATRPVIHARLRKLRQVVGRQDNLLIYFSGHGEVDGDVGYWVPVEAHPERDWEFIGTSALKDRLSAIDSFHTFVIIDACFSGSLFTTYKSVRPGYETKRSRLGLAASHSRERALDGTPGENSPFARCLLRRLREQEGHLGVQKLAAEVIEEVQAATRGRQTPVFKTLDVKGDDQGQFVFHPRADEAADWAACQKTGTLEAMQAFLARYPEGKHAGEAQKQLAFLEEEAAWNKSREQHTIKAYIRYRHDYPEGRYREQALEAIRELEEEQAWRRAKRRNTVYEYERYLDKYPNGKYRQEVETAMDVILNDENTTQQWEQSDFSKNRAQFSLFTDPRDNQVYQTIEFNGLTWMAENLNFDVGEGCSFYNDDPDNGKVFGRLYTWEAAKNACPTGWRLPTSEELDQLGKSFSGQRDAFQALMKGGVSGFNAVFGGKASKGGRYAELKEYGYYWTDTETEARKAIDYRFKRKDESFYDYDDNKSFRFSCRCVKESSRPSE